jgi:quercetin dioxygenase-like cupin family protein
VRGPSPDGGIIVLRRPPVLLDERDSGQRAKGDALRTPDDELGGDPPCWAHLFEDDLAQAGDPGPEHGPRAAPAGGGTVDLAVLARSAAHGPVWTTRGDELDVNLLVFEADHGVAEHINDQVDVLLVGIAGRGIVTIDGLPHAFAAGRAVLIPKGARRGTRAVEGRFAYLTCHRRRSGLMPVLENRTGA